MALGEGQPSMAPIIQPTPAAASLPVGSFFSGDEHGGISLLTSVLLHVSSPPSRKDATTRLPKSSPSLPALTEPSFFSLIVPCCGRARLPGLQPCCHPAQLLLLPASLADLSLLPRRLGCSWGGCPSCCYPQHCLLSWGLSSHSPPCRWPLGCSRKSCCGAGTG